MQWSLTKLLAGCMIVLIMNAPTARAELICLGNISQDLIGNIDDVGQIVTGEQTSWANGSTIRLPFLANPVVNLKASARGS
ncbi:MAG: hypothetical protein ACO3TX_10780 [Pseudomonadales bacterium]